MANVKQMKAVARPRAGKGAARAERRAGRVPGVIYGDGQPPVTVSVDHKDLKERIYAGRFLTSIYELDVDGTTHRVIPRDFQLDAVKDLPLHVDFLRLGVGRPDSRPHSGPRPQCRPVARREARRHRQHRHPRDRDGSAGGRHSGGNRRRYRAARDQPLEASGRPDAAVEREGDLAGRHHAGHHRAAVGLRRRNEGRRRSCCCCCNRCCRRRRSRHCACC